MEKEKLFVLVVLMVLVFTGTTVFAGGMAKKPIDLSNVNAEDVDREIIRLGIVAELDAVSLYEQLAANAKSKEVKKVMLHTAKEEKTHVGEFQALLLKLDKEQQVELKEGEKELKELLSE